MIVRQAIWRAGRRATQTARPSQIWQRRWQRRTVATRTLDPEINLLDARLENRAGELSGIEREINAQSNQNIAGKGPGAPAHQTPELARVWQTFQDQEQSYEGMGSEMGPHYRPHALLSNPPGPEDITPELLLASEAHLGHSTALWHPGNARYIFGVRQGIHIISLEQTAAHLRRAARIVTEVTRRGGVVLYVGTKRGQNRAVVKAASLGGGCHLFEKWIPGTITNAQQIIGRCHMMVVDENDQPVTGFEEQLSNRAALKPDLVVCLNPIQNGVLLRECAQNHVPTIGVVDTNCIPTVVTYPIPANDDSLRTSYVIAGVLGRAGQEGWRQRREAVKQNKITFMPAELQMPGKGTEGEMDPKAYANSGYKPKDADD